MSYAFYSIYIYVSSITRWERKEGDWEENRAVGDIHEQLASWGGRESHALQLSSCFADFCSGPPKNTGILNSVLTNDLKHMWFIWEQCIPVLYFEAGTADWLDCDTRKLKISVDLDLNDGRMWMRHSEEVLSDVTFLSF